MQKVLASIATERERQDKKWGQQDHDPLEWYAILGEEFGEIGKALCERAAELRSGYDIVASLKADQARDELIQLAAVAVAMLESLERNQDVAL